jgi:hypothetical protein
MMKILSVRPQAGGNTLARFDVELPGGLRLFNVKLVRNANGLRAYAPSEFGSPAATFTRELAIELIEAASAAYGDIDQHDSSRAA